MARFFSLFLTILTFSSTSFADEPRVIPNDQFFSSQWWADNDGRTLMFSELLPDQPGKALQFHLQGKADIDIDLPEAWAIEQGSPDCVIAILDSGFQLDHPDLYYQYWVNEEEREKNRGDDDHNSFPDDYQGWNFLRNDAVLSGGLNHGTLVAGVAAAEMNNGIGIAGVAPGCKIMPLVVADTSHTLLVDNVLPSMEAMAKAIRYAVEKKVSVISISVGLPPIDLRKEAIRSYFFGNQPIPPDQDKVLTEELFKQELVAKVLLTDAVDLAYKYGIPIVASAGNTKREEKIFPAAFDKVISVGSVNNAGNPSTFSTKGDWITVSAPGEFILSTYETGVCGGPLPCCVGGVCHAHADYAHETGTSFSTPMVAGVIALLRSRNPDLSIEEIRSILKSTGKKLEGGEKIGPLVKAAAALREAERLRDNK